MMQNIYASSPGILVRDTDFIPGNPVVLLPQTDTIGELITIKDTDGLASVLTPITVSTVAGVSFVDGTSTLRISSVQITDAGDSVAVAAASPFLYMMIRSRQFPYVSQPFYLRPNLENISTVSTHTLDVISSIVLPQGSALDPLLSIQTGVGAAFEFKSTHTTTFFGSNVEAFQLRTDSLSTVALSTHSILASSLRAETELRTSSLYVAGTLDAPQVAVSITGNFSTIAGGVPFQNNNIYGSGDFTVVGPLSTTKNYTALGGSFGIADALRVDSNFNAGNLVVWHEASHASTVYATGLVSTPALYTYYNGNTSSMTIGRAFGSASASASGPAAALDVSGSAFFSSIFSDNTGLSAGFISTNSYSASTIDLFNGTKMQTLYPSTGEYLWYGPTVMSNPGPLIANPILSSMYVSTFVSSAAVFASTAFIGAKDYDSSYMFELNGGMNVSYKRPDFMVTTVFTQAANNPQGSIRYSLNSGSNWNNITSGGFSGIVGNNVGTDVKWNGRYWVSVGEAVQLNSRSTIMFSINGSNWIAAASGGFNRTSNSNPQTSQGNSIDWNGNMWVAVGDGNSNTNTILYSFDGRNWSNAASGGFSNSGSNAGIGGRAVKWNGRIWVAFGASNTNLSNFQYSFNGINWSNGTSPAGITDFRILEWNGRIWTAGGFGASNIFYSFNGINWSNCILPATNNFTAGIRSLLWDGNILIAGGTNTNGAQSTLMFSYDGITWRHTPSKNNWFTATFSPNDIKFDGEKYYATRTGMKFSFDLINWINSADTATDFRRFDFQNELGPDLKINNLELYTAAAFSVKPSSINTLYTRTSGFFPERTLSTNIILNNLVHICPPRGVGIGGIVSSAAINLIVYGSTFTSDPNPIKPGGGNWTVFSDSNFKSTIELGQEDYYSTTTCIFRQLKIRNFNYRSDCGIAPYVNESAIARRNCYVHESCASTCLSALQTYEHKTTEVGFLAQNVATVLPDSVEQIRIAGRDYYALNVDQINMIHIAATHSLMSTLQIQQSTLKGQEAMIEKINENFIRIRSHMNL